MSPTMPRQPEPEVMDLPEEAAAYAHADFAAVNQAFVDRLVELAGDLDRPRCLELGVGPADITVRLLAARPAWHVTAVDASPPMLGFARHAISQAGLSKRIELVHADAKSTPLPARFFNVIFANSILHHIDDTLRFWREVKRLGAPGACVFLRDLRRPVSVEAAHELVSRHACQESELLRGEYLRSLLASYTPQEVRRQLTAAGLGQLRVETITDRHMDIFGRLT